MHVYARDLGFYQIRAQELRIFLEEIMLVKKLSLYS